MGSQEHSLKKLHLKSNFFNKINIHGMTYSTPGPWTPDVMHISQRGERPLAQEIGVAH